MWNDSVRSHSESLSAHRISGVGAFNLYELSRKVSLFRIASAVTDLTVALLSLAKQFVMIRSIVTRHELLLRQFVILSKLIQASGFAFNVVH